MTAQQEPQPATQDELRSFVAQLQHGDDISVLGVVQEIRCHRNDHT